MSRTSLPALRPLVERRHQLDAITWGRSPPSVISRRPNIRLSTFVEEVAFGQLIVVFEWYLAEVQKG